LLIAAAALAAAQTPEGELREGVALTSRGQFDQAIPHFLAARGQVSNSFALEFNLALCYVGTRHFKEAIAILEQLRAEARTKNLLAQALVGDHQEQAAWTAFSEAAALAPNGESLYMLVSQACIDEGLNELGRRVLEVGLRNLPDSAKLHFQRGVVLSLFDANEMAALEFQKVRSMAHDSEIEFLAKAEEAMIFGRMDGVIRATREGIQKGYEHYLLLTMLGEALLRSGATPDTPAEFHEAQTALEKAVSARPSYISAHIALGRVYLAQGRTADATAQLEIARRIDPRNKAVYPPLAVAYQRSGQGEKVKEVLAALAGLNKDDAERTRNADGGHAGYVSNKKKP
jgi:tetratricopeptide (TPR) repeat protein